MKSSSIKIGLAALLTIFLVLGLGMPTGEAAAGTLCVNPGGTDGCYASIQEAFAAAAVSDTIQVQAGTYVLGEQVTLNKANVTLQGVGDPVIQVSGTGYRFLITASGVTLDGLTIEKTDTAGVQNIIGIQASDVSITNNTIYGQFVIGDADFSRAMEMSGGITGLLVSGNEIHNLRQPAYINTPVTGTISNNYVHTTKGWVVDGGGVTFTGNTWGTGAEVNVYDIAIISGATPGYYPDIVTMSDDNNGAVIEDQRVAPAVLSVVYVDAATAYSSDLGGRYHPYATITPAITRVVAGGTIHVAAGTYVEELTIDKSLTLLGPNANINPNTGVRVAEAILLPANIGLDIGGTCTRIINLSGVLEEVTVKGFTLDGSNPALHSGVFINGIETAACQGIAGRNNLSGIVVENNIIKNVIHSAVYLRNLDTPGPTSGNYIRYNKIDNLGTVGKPYGYGVIVQNNFYADITGNVITAARTGIQTNTYSLANPGTTGSISNNSINAWRSGIFHYHWYNTASSIAVANNTITPMAHAGAGWWNGIVLADFGTTGSTTVVDNTITVAPGFTFIDASYSAGYNVISDSPTVPLTISGGTVTGADYGVFVNNYEGYPDIVSDPTSIVIDGVTIQNSSIAGVYVKDSPDNTNALATVFANIQNSVIDSAGTGILIDGADASAQANYNQIAGNPTAGVTNPNTAVMNAQDNWWGVASGPAGAGTGSGDAVSANVAFQPWCVDADCLASTPFTTTTSISSDLPDPSSRGNLVTIQVSVTNNAPGGQVPAGTVDVSDGTSEICSNIALSAGTGSCTYNFPTSGTFTLSATFTPADTALFSSSTGTASHRVVSKPILLSPANAAQLLYNRPTFDWTDVSNANSYKIQVARDSAFTDRIINIITSTSSYKPANPLPAGVTLYWRARVETPFVSKWSKVFTFTTAKPPSVPSLFLPANGAVLSDTTPVLDWSNSTVPAGTTFDHYQLQVYTTPGSPKSSLVLQKTRLVSIYTFGTPLAPGTYYWRVRSYNSDGQYSEWSQVWSFTIQP